VNPSDGPTADRWRRIEELFSSLLELSGEERQAALDRVEDPDLRAEVRRLLDVHEELATGEGGFLESLDSMRASEILQGSPDLNEGASVGRYRILRRLGRGGMGVVYQAEDPRLGRSVALKLLPPHLSADPAAVRRLTAEARAASALDHPNIETVYEIGETADDRIFIAMAYYEGETLRERIAGGPMSVDEAVDLGVQLADGLSVAHRGGIVHRDVKPENILVTRDGVLKLVDFGIAKLVGEGVTSVGVTPGTAAYMSPEQTRGEAVDERTDLWSTGVVLYEMLAGERPFRGQGEALVHAIRNDPPRPLRDIRPELAPALVAVVERCLAKSPERRLESAAALGTELGSAAGRPATRMAGPGRRTRSRTRWMAGAGVVTALVLVGLLARSGREIAAPTPAEVTAPGIAVLPFEVRGDGLDVWREGMVDLLSVGLDGAADLRTIDSRTVLARWKELAGAGEADLATYLSVARATGARYTILGSVLPLGADLRLVADVYEVERGRRLGQAQVEGPQGEILELIDRLAIQSLGIILERDQGLPEIDLANMTSASLPSVREYLGGEVLLRRGEYAEAVAAYERAVEADSTFALAWFGIAAASGWLESGSNPRGPEAMVRALSYPILPERERLVGRGGILLDGEVLGPLRMAVRRHPDDARLWWALGEIYFHLSETALVGPEDAMSAFQRAIELDPGFAPYWIHFINLAFFVDPDSMRIGHAIEAYGRVAKEVEGHRLAHELAFGDPETRTRARAALEEVDDEVFANAHLDLQHPRYYGELFPLLEVRLLRAPPHLKPVVISILARQSLWAGRVRRGLEYFDDPRIAADSDLVHCRKYAAYARGLPVPPSSLDTMFSAAVIESPDGRFVTTVRHEGLWVGCIGAWAADRGRWDDHARVIDAMRNVAGEALADGDSLSWRRLDAVAQALEGYAAWKRGSPAEALRLLDAARPSLGGYSSPRALPHGWWTGQILLELGRPAEAARYFRAQWDDPLAHYELAKIYDQLGEDAKARTEYETFIAGWSGADPELQPLVERARDAVARLVDERRSRRLQRRAFGKDFARHRSRS
jgi:tetratricopeptide (TPR) repeat protein